MHICGPAQHSDMMLSVGATKIEIAEGDVTEQSTDAIVNAANSSLMGGGGVDGAIHRKGGPAIVEECRRIRASQWRDGLPTGKAVMTSGGRLKARYVIHTVGPVWRGGHEGEQELLADCYRNTLILAKSSGLRSVAFPSISTGAYGYPISLASGTALATVKDFLENESGLDEVVFVLFTERDRRVYEGTASRIFNPSP